MGKNESWASTEFKDHHQLPGKLYWVYFFTIPFEEIEWGIVRRRRLTNYELVTHLRVDNYRKLFNVSFCLKIRQLKENTSVDFFLSFVPSLQCEELGLRIPPPLIATWDLRSMLLQRNTLRHSSRPGDLLQVFSLGRFALLILHLWVPWKSLLGLL